eukprot:SAG11_NODE_5629_length_1503_cov_1.120370_1_plen_183_part_00
MRTSASESEGEGEGEGILCAALLRRAPPQRRSARPSRRVGAGRSRRVRRSQCGRPRAPRPVNAPSCRACARPRSPRPLRERGRQLGRCRQLERRGGARRGEARRGGAGRGEARRGEARPSEWHGGGKAHVFRTGKAASRRRACLGSRAAPAPAARSATARSPSQRRDCYYCVRIVDPYGITV